MDKSINDDLLLMHDDARPAAEADSEPAWARYLERLHRTGRFVGGSAIGTGACYRKSELPAPLSASLTGYLRVQAASLGEAKSFLAGNSVYETGGSVEIRELARD